MDWCLTFKSGEAINAVMCEIITLNKTRTDEEDPNRSQALCTSEGKPVAVNYESCFETCFGAAE